LACRVPLWERCLLAMNDDSVGLMNRGVWLAGKPRSNGKLSRLLEPSLLAKNDDAVWLACRVPLWERCLPAMNDDSVGAELARSHRTGH
ncbi:hypothetical protein, partial [Pseudomonas syringae]|uniref:hypothetical protein n=1 Tax=Pseudomonas syringae TaxID=317 RepID=UPI000515B1CC